MSDCVMLTHDSLDMAAASAAVGADEAGAISLFVGTTRCSFETKRVVSLEYEAYAPMAELEMSKLCTLAKQRCPEVIAVAIFHRLGSVPAGEASVIIAVSSPHRKDAIGENSFPFSTVFGVCSNDVCIRLFAVSYFWHVSYRWSNVFSWADSCHFVIDELKARVPIWKRECYEDGSVWKQNAEFSTVKSSAIFRKYCKE